MTQELLDCLQTPTPSPEPEAAETAAAASSERDAAPPETALPEAPGEPAPPESETAPPEPEATQPGGSGDLGRTLREHYESLVAAGRALQREFRDFDMTRALRDPEFVRLTAPGVGLDPRRAWLALHPEILEQRAADQARSLLARSLASGADRPREGGSPNPAVMAADYSAMSRPEQLRLKERILQASARGEKIYP